MIQRMPWRWQGEEWRWDVPDRGSRKGKGSKKPVARGAGGGETGGLLEVGTEEDGTSRRWG